MRSVALCLVAGATVLAAIVPAFAQSTTRIETRPVYGAIVTFERGVRVFRPLPPHDRVIINPNNTPIYLGINDGPTYSYGPSYAPSMGGGYAGPGYAGAWAGGTVRRHFRRHAPRHGPRAHGVK